MITTIILWYATLVAFLAESHEYMAISMYTGEGISVDGALSEPGWKNAQRLPLSNNLDGSPVDDISCQSHAMACHDSEYLYLAFVNHDRAIFSSFTHRDDFLWKEEAVEVFIDTDPVPSTYIELEISPANVLFDSYITDTADIDLVVTPGFELQGWLTAVRVQGTLNDNADQDSLWTVEMAIPFAALKSDFSAEKLPDYRWRINFYRLDRDEFGPTHYAWSPTGGRFHMPSKFGTIIFGKD